MLENPPVRDQADWGCPLENWVDLENNNFLLNQPRNNPNFEWGDTTNTCYAEGARIKTSM